MNVTTCEQIFTICFVIFSWHKKTTHANWSCSFIRLYVHFPLNGSQIWNSSRFTLQYNSYLHKKYFGFQEKKEFIYSSNGDFCFRFKLKIHNPTLRKLWFHAQTLISTGIYTHNKQVMKTMGTVSFRTRKRGEIYLSITVEINQQSKSYMIRLRIGEPSQNGGEYVCGTCVDSSVSFRYVHEDV